MRALKIIGMIAVIAAVAAGGFFFGYRSGSAQTETFRELLWRDLYASVLRTYIDPEYPDSGFAKFNLYDLDGDGIPELIVSGGDFHAAGAEIYTLYRGAVYCHGGFGSWGDFGYEPETGYIYSGYSGMGCHYASIHQIVNGQMIEIASFADTMANFEHPEDRCFEVNGEKVSEDEYNRAWEEYGYNTDDDFTARKYDVNEDEIARVLSLPY